MPANSTRPPDVSTGALPTEAQRKRVLELLALLTGVAAVVVMLIDLVVASPGQREAWIAGCLAVVAGVAAGERGIVVVRALEIRPTVGGAPGHLSDGRRRFSYWLVWIPDQRQKSAQRFVTGGASERRSLPRA